jgi:hypothetical protein
VRSALFAALWLSSGCRCGPDTSTVDEQPLRVTPAALDFGSVYAGGSRSLGIDVVNPNAVGLSVTSLPPPPFGAAPFNVGAGSDYLETIVFAPTDAGTFSGIVILGDAGVEVTGVGLAVPPCSPSDACHASAFDLNAGKCVETSLPDGTDCAASRACFAQAQCMGGVCLGTLTTCDDGNPCTTDVCGVDGCGHVDGLFACPESLNPCLVPSCDPDAGCGFVPVPDGTVCGDRSCQSALVCINAACVMRAAPQTQGCTDVVAGNPESSGNADGFGHNARFSYVGIRLAVDAAQTVWLTDYANGLLRKVTPAGEVITIAGSRPTALQDGFGPNAGLQNPQDLAVDATGDIVFWDTFTWRRATRQGLVVTWLGTKVNMPTTIDGVGAAASVGQVEGITLGGDTLFTLELDENNARVVLRSISTLGEIVTLRSLGPPVDNYRLAYAQGALFIASSGQGVDRFVGGASVRFWSGMGMQRIAASPAGELAISRGYDLLVLAPDAGVQATWASATNTILDVAPYAPGRWVVALRDDSSNTPRLAIIDDAGTTLLAGPDWPLPDVDGPIATSGLLDPDGITTGLGGDIFVFERLGVRRIGDGQITTWWQQPPLNRDLATLASGAILATLPSSVIALTGVDAGVVWAPALSCSGLDVRGAEVAASCYDGIHTWVDVGTGQDAGVIRFFGGPDDIALEDDGGFLGLSRQGVNAIGPDGGLTLLTPLADGGNTATRLARLPGGDLFVADPETSSIYRVTASGTVTTVVTLADRPTNLTVEDGGTLLVTVPDAVLRVYP